MSVVACMGTERISEQLPELTAVLFSVYLTTFSTAHFNSTE